MGIKKEEPTPENPALGLVWTSILAQVDDVGSESDYVTVTDTLRENLRRHPWSMGGGGAAELKERLDNSATQFLGDLAEEMGRTSVVGEDDAWILDSSSAARSRLSNSVLPYGVGECLRDWQAIDLPLAIYPYRSFTGAPVDEVDYVVAQYLWSLRTLLRNRTVFGKSVRPWFAHLERYTNKMQTPLGICFAFVATHNHFVFDRGGKLFKQSAPVIKFADSATEADNIAQLGCLNSSAACFWMKQVFHDKGSGGIGGGISAELWERRFEHDCTKLKQFPIPAIHAVALGTELDRLAQALKSHTPLVALTTSASHTHAALDAAKQRWTETLQRMIALQEELDWECYQLYGLTEAKLVLPPDEVPLLRLGERAFEIVMARKLAAGELHTTWFERHGSKPITELPAHWPPHYRELVQRRIALMESDRNIALIEQPEYKRRWNLEPWDEQLKRALRAWLLNRLEGYFFDGERMSVAASRQSAANLDAESNSTGGLPTAATEDGLAAIRAHWPAGQHPSLVSTNQLAAVVETDADFLRVAEIYSGGPGFSVSKLVRELVEAESVPFLPFQRYKDTGLRKRQDWEHVWHLQRQEDEFDAQIEPLKKELDTAKKNYTRDQENDDLAIKWIRLEKELEEKIEALEEQKKKEVGTVPVPPKYASGDFKKSNWWKLRGKLDVPKERWIIYLGAERDADPSPVIAWAGWDHLQQAKALAGYYVDANTNLGWSPEKLQPLLAGLADLLPWLKQWHNEFDPEVTSGLGDYFAGFLNEEARKQGTTVETLDELKFRQS